MSHVPGFIGHKALKDAGNVVVVSVNDVFVYAQPPRSLWRSTDRRQDEGVGRVDGGTDQERGRTDCSRSPVHR